MGLDLTSYLRDAFSWAGGQHTDGGNNFGETAAAGAGTFGAQTQGNDLLGGMVGGFGGPMDWKGAGFGGQGGMSWAGDNGGFAGGNLGLGFGGLGSSWSQTGADGTQRDGVSGVAGGVAPVGVYGGTSDFNGYANTNVYSGVGGSAYSYSKGTDQGAGVNFSATPIGLGDTNYGVSTPIGSIDSHADDMYFNRLAGSGTFGQDGDTYHGNGSASFGMGGSGFSQNISTPLGDVDSHAGSVFYGTGVDVGGSYNTSTGVATGSLGLHDGLDVKNAGVNYSGGPVNAGINAGEIQYGVNGTANATYDPNKGQLNANVDGHGGGINVDNIDAQGSWDGVGSGSAHLGNVSNDIQVKGNAEINGEHAGVSGVSLDGMGVRMSDFKAQGQAGDFKGGASFESLGNNNDIHGAYADVNWGGDHPGVSAGFDDMIFGSWSGSNLNANIQGPGGLDAGAHVGSFGTGFAAEKFKATIDGDGLNASLGHGQYSDVDIKDVNEHVDWGPYHQSASLGEGASDKFDVTNANVSLNGDGLNASVGHGSYDEVYLKGLKTHQGVDGVFGTDLGLGEGSMNHASADNAYLKANGDGVSAGFQNGQYDFLTGKDINIGANVGDGAVGVGAHADQASLGSVDVGKLDYSTNLESSHLNVDNLDAAGWKSKNLDVNANVGALGADVGAQQLNIADLSVKNAHADTSNYGLTGNAGVQGANFDALNVQGGHAGLGWDGQEFLGATGDFRSGGGVDSANANWDITSGTASADFKNASFGSQLNNANLDLFGMNVGLPDMGYKVNASGGANVDLSQGAASANLGLGGTSVNFGGYEATIPDWVQGSAGVNLSQGAANFNLGGENGVGADINLSKGDFKLDAFGYEADIGQGVRDVGGAISDGASAVGGAISDGWDAVTDW